MIECSRIFEVMVFRKNSLTPEESFTQALGPERSVSREWQRQIVINRFELQKKKEKILTLNETASDF